MSNSISEDVSSLPGQERHPKTWRGALWAGMMMCFHLIASLGAYFFILVLAAIWIMESQDSSLTSEQRSKLMFDGDLVAPSFVLGAIITMAGLLLVLRFQREKAGEVLAWSRCSGVMLAMAICSTLGLMGAWLALDQVMDRPMNEFMAQMMLSTNYRIPLYATFIIAAPLIEEVVFRGYMYHQLMRTPLPRVAVVLVISVLFTLIHFQYHVYELVQVFTLGVLLSVMRDRSGSLAPSLVVHVLWNAISCGGLEYWFQQQSP
ncbi:MAG: CPBP family intramembrane glutamic endopeptidase [Verrucomicrobiota bacterium]